MNLKEKPEAVPILAFCYCRGHFGLQGGGFKTRGPAVKLLLVGSCDAQGHVKSHLHSA